MGEKKLKIKFLFLLFRKISYVGSTRFPKVRGPHIKSKVVLKKKRGVDSCKPGLVHISNNIISFMYYK